MLAMRNSEQVFKPDAKSNEADQDPRWAGRGDVLQRDEKRVSDGEMVAFPGPLLRADMPKDQLMAFIQAKQQECLRHLDNPDQQKSFFFWSIMERVINKNGKVMMLEISVLLFKGHGLLRRKLGRVANREDWCLPLAELLCSTAPRDRLREEIIEMGDDFDSRGWLFAAQICYVVAGMKLGARPHFKVIGCESLPLGNVAAMMEVMERTEVFEFALSLNSGCGQPFFQEIKLECAFELATAGHNALALNYCESIFPQILKLKSLQATFVDNLIMFRQFLLDEIDKEPAVEEIQEPAEFHPSHDKTLNERFMVGELLGEGGFGSVFAGVRKADGKEVAIKCAAKRPDDAFITIPGETRSLPVEVALLEMVSKAPRSNHVIEMLEWFETPTHFILVLERPNPCMDLGEFCKMNYGRLSEAVAKKIMWQVVEAARHCCDRGVLHRDIKTENILINPHTLEAKLIDFGCGDLLKDGYYREMAGTWLFWPFEWIFYGYYRGVDATIWSLGVLLFNLVCGCLPFTSDEDIIEGDLRFSSHLSPECCNLISWCLKQDPKHRATFQDILNHSWFKAETSECPDERVRMKQVRFY